MPTTDQDLRALTYLASRLRDETHGCAQWDEAGTFACLKDALHGQNLLISMQRVIGHATDPDAKTPGAIKRPFVPQVASAPTRQPFDPRKTCATCSLLEPRCRELHRDDHEFLAVDRARSVRGAPIPKALRDAITPTRSWPATPVVPVPGATHTDASEGATKEHTDG
jgi:hypothetical protein